MTVRWQWSVLGLIFLAGCGAAPEDSSNANRGNPGDAANPSGVSVAASRSDDWLTTPASSPAQTPTASQNALASPASQKSVNTTTLPSPIQTAALPASAPRPAVNAITAEESAQIKARIEELSQQTTTAQNEFRFQQAVPLWREMTGLLTRAYGAGSWQVTNARIAEQLAQQQAQMDNASLEKMRELFQWQQKIGELLGQNSIAPALTLAEGSADRTAELFGAQSFMKGKQQLQVARMKQMLGKPEPAAAAYRDAYQLMAPHLGNIHPELEGLHSYLGECQLALGQFDQGIENLRAAARQAAELWGENSVKFAARANDLGVAYQRSGDLAMAVKILRTAEEIRRQQLGENHPQVGHSLLNLGTVYIEYQSPELAQQCLEQALPILGQLSQPHPLLVDCHAKMAVVKMLLGKPAEAEPFLQAVVTGLNGLRADDRELGIAEHRLGVALAKQGKYIEAEPVLRSSEQRLARLLGEEHAQTARVRDALAQLLVQTGRQQEADSLKSGIRQVNFESSGGTFRK